MKVAIPIWDGRVSPVMDTACHVLVVELAGCHEVSRALNDFPAGNLPNRVNFLVEKGINTLICGAVSQQFERLAVASGIRVHPWFRGDVEQIIAAFSNGIFLHDDNFVMPGRGRRRQAGRRCGQGRGFGRLRQLKEN